MAYRGTISYDGGNSGNSDLMINGPVQPASELKLSEIVSTIMLNSAIAETFLVDFKNRQVLRAVSDTGPIALKVLCNSAGSFFDGSGLLELFRVPEGDQGKKTIAFNALLRDHAGNAPAYAKGNPNIGGVLDPDFEPRIGISTLLDRIEDGGESVIVAFSQLSLAAMASDQGLQIPGVDSPGQYSSAGEVDLQVSFQDGDVLVVSAPQHEEGASGLVDQLTGETVVFDKVSVSAPPGGSTGTPFTFE